MGGTTSIYIYIYIIYVCFKGSLKELPCYGYLWWPRTNEMTWVGMEWNRLEWNGLDWNGLEWNGMTWHGTKASSFRFWRKSRTKALFSHLQLSDFEGSLAWMLCFRIFHFQILKGSLARKLRFHIFRLSVFAGSLARNAFLRDSGCTKCCVLQDKTCPGRWMGKLVRRTVAKHARLGSDHSRIGRAVELPVQASF